MGFSIVEYLRNEERRKQMSVSSYSGASQIPVGYGRGSGVGLEHDRRNDYGLLKTLSSAKDFFMDFAAQEITRVYSGRLNRRFSLGV